MNFKPGDRVVWIVRNRVGTVCEWEEPLTVEEKLLFVPIKFDDGEYHSLFPHNYKRTSKLRPLTKLEQVLR